jgi:UDP-N-acetylglucosamine 2-epimerase (non-hydrolysing)
MLLTPSGDANENLEAEGINSAGIRLVGNVMIDSLEWMLKRIDSTDVCLRLTLPSRPYALLTLHRPSNVDDPKILLEILSTLAEVSRDLPIVFPVHPRTETRMRAMTDTTFGGIEIQPALPYDDFVAVMSRASVVLTDSGGVQEEALILGVPCITLRSTTERPITVTCGGNRVLGMDAQAISAAIADAMNGSWGSIERPMFWDGQTAERILVELRDIGQLARARRMFPQR